MSQEQSEFRVDRNAFAQDSEIDRWAEVSASQLLGTDLPAEAAPEPEEWNFLASSPAEAAALQMSDEFEEQDLDSIAVGVAQRLADRHKDKTGPTFYRAMDRMREPIRTVSILHFGKEWEFERVASHMGLSAETVEFLIDVALDQLDPIVSYEELPERTDQAISYRRRQRDRES